SVHHPISPTTQIVLVLKKSALSSSILPSGTGMCCGRSTAMTASQNSLTDCRTANQTLQEVAMLRSHQFTQIQRFPANSAQRCNFNTSPQLSRTFDNLLLSPTTFFLPLHQGRKFCPVDTVQTLAEFSSVVNNENGYTRHGYCTQPMSTLKIR